MVVLRLLLVVALVAAAKASLADRVVPEDQMLDLPDVVPATTLLSVDAPEVQGELATLAIHAHTEGQKAAIKQVTDTMALLETPKDGGTQALADRVKAMTDVVEPAIDTMKAGLDSDFTTAQGDLGTLLGAINSTQRAVLDTEKAAIKAAAQKWCAAWKAKGVAVARCTSATTNLTAFNPTISVTDALYKNIGSITDCPAGTAQVNGKCPAGVVNLDEGTGQLKIGFQKARDDYYDLSTIKTDECDDKDDKTGHEATNKTAYDTEIKTTLDDHVAGCTPDNNVYTSAVSSFNTNNGHRAAMYEALDKVMCYVSNINGRDTDNSTTAATDITNCKTAMQPSSYYTAKFADYNTAAPTCPTRAQYATQVSTYESLSLIESWIPSDTTCDAVAAPPPAAGTALLQCFDASGNSEAEVTTVAGVGMDTSRNYGRHADGDGTAALFNAPQNMAITSDGAFLYILDSWAATSYVRKMSTTAPYTVTTVAGGASGYHDDPDGLQAQFAGSGIARALAISSDDRYLFLADSENNRIRKIDLRAPHAVTSIAGTGTRGCGAGELQYPQGLTMSADGTALFVANQGCNNVVKIMLSDGAISEVASRFVGPCSIATLDADTLFVGEQQTGGGDATDRIYSVKVSTGVKTLLLSGFDNPRALSISADKTTLFVDDSYNAQMLGYDLTTTPLQKKVLAGGYNQFGQTDATGTNARFGQSLGLLGPDTHTLFVSDHWYGTIRQIRCPRR